MILEKEKRFWVERPELFVERRKAGCSDVIRPAARLRLLFSILLQKSKVASARETLKRDAIDDSDSLNCATEAGPQIFTRKTRLRPSEFFTPSAKRLLQHYPHQSGHHRARLRILSRDYLPQCCDWLDGHSLYDR
jgi:hypothetical protein